MVEIRSEAMSKLERFLNHTRAELDEVVRHLHEQLGEQLIAVALFGSRARGEATGTSDWDLLVVATGLPERPLARYQALKRCLPPYWRGRISLLARTPGEFESALPPLFLDIAADGQVLYDPTGYLSGRLQQVRRLIRRLGLIRRRRGRELVWCWQTSPPTRWSLQWEEPAG